MRYSNDECSQEAEVVRDDVGVDVDVGVGVDVDVVSVVDRLHRVSHDDEGFSSLLGLDHQFW